ncbi:MAG: hypothetical protein DHS20C09_11180 [marine bacterium B5-7]|nr:MAG: hypothetical protein DHS20C09_11180 [marine bacterium B5-7]
MNTEKVLKIIERGATILSGSQDQVLNLFIGLTGAGKSTIVNAALGLDLVFNSDTRRVEFSNDILDVESLIARGEAARMGHVSSKSATLYPQVYHAHQRKYALLDCAGLEDTRSAEHQVAMSICLESALRKAKAINGIFIVINAKEFGARNAQLKQLVELMTNLFQDISLAKGAIQFVFTNVEDQYTAALAEEGIKDLGDAKRHEQATSKVFDRLYRSISDTRIFFEELRRDADCDLEGETDDSLQLLDDQISFCHLIETAIKKDDAILFNAAQPSLLKRFSDTLLKRIDSITDAVPEVPRNAFNFHVVDNTRYDFEKALKSKYQSFLYKKKGLSDIERQIRGFSQEDMHLSNLVDGYQGALDVSKQKLAINEANTTGFESINQLELALDKLNEASREKQEKLVLAEQALTRHNEELADLQSDALLTKTVKRFDFKCPEGYIYGAYPLGFESKTLTCNLPVELYENCEIRTSEGDRAQVLEPAKQGGQFKFMYWPANQEQDRFCEVIIHYKKCFQIGNPQKVQIKRGQRQGKLDVVNAAQRAFDQAEGKRIALMREIANKKAGIVGGQRLLQTWRDAYIKRREQIETDLGVLAEQRERLTTEIEENEAEMENLQSLAGKVSLRLGDERDRGENDLATERPVAEAEVQVLACDHTFSANDFYAHLEEKEANGEQASCPDCVSHDGPGKDIHLTEGDFSLYRFKPYVPHAAGQNAQDALFLAPQTGQQTEQALAAEKIRNDQLLTDLQFSSSRMGYLHDRRTFFANANASQAAGPAYEEAGHEWELSSAAESAGTQGFFAETGRSRSAGVSSAAGPAEEPGTASAETFEFNPFN